MLLDLRFLVEEAEATDQPGIAWSFDGAMSTTPVDDGHWWVPAEDAVVPPDPPLRALGVGSRGSGARLIVTSTGEPYQPSAFRRR